MSSGKEMMKEAPKSSTGWWFLRRVLVVVAVFATLVAAFYAEEDYRGKQAWERCKRRLESQGVVLDWSAYIPPAIPDDQNFFKASPDIEQRFTKSGGWSGLNQTVTTVQPRLFPRRTNDFPLFGGKKSRSLVVAEITVLAPGAATADSEKAKLVLQSGDPEARSEMGELIRDTIGRIALGSAGYQFSKFQTHNLVPAPVVLRAEKPASASDLESLLPVNAFTNVGHLKIEAAPDGKAFRVLLTGSYLIAAADYLKWSDQYESDFDEVREALKRPGFRMDGDYSMPFQGPVPDFVIMRTIAQTLAQRAQCYLLLGQPDRALEQMTFIHDVCRILERTPDHKALFLVDAMINVAINGLYAMTVGDGLRWHAWQEPQLAALQGQLADTRLMPQVISAFEAERAASCFTLASTPGPKIAALFVSSRGPSASAQRWTDPQFLYIALCPRGWIYQNAAFCAIWIQQAVSGYDPTNQTVSPRSFDQLAKHVPSARNPYSAVGALVLPNLVKATQTAARNQTTVNEAQVACALERYRLAHGEYPDRLDALVPQYMGNLPHDIIGGRPLHYRRTDDGKFLLYSVGWNETDDGGRESSGSNTNGDWVWKP